MERLRLIHVRSCLIINDLIAAVIASDVMHFALIPPSSAADDACPEEIVEQGGEGGDGARNVCHESGVEDGARMRAFCRL